MMKYAFPVIRILLGLVFLVSGLEKTMSPYQNFLFVIQGYQFIPLPVEKMTAVILPWIELFTGIFLVLGLWIRWSLVSAAVMFVGFMVVVGQALIRGLDLSECGCFGELIHIPPQMIFVMDSVMFLSSLLLWKNVLWSRLWSLDGYFASSS